MRELARRLHAHPWTRNASAERRPSNLNSEQQADNRNSEQLADNLSSERRARNLALQNLHDKMGVSEHRFILVLRLLEVSNNH